MPSRIRVGHLRQGYTKEYWVEFAGLRAELTQRQCEFVMDVLDMFRIASYSIKALQEQGVDVSDELMRSLRFRGFDHNDALESQMLNYVTFLIESGKWTEQEDSVFGSDRGISHMQMVDIYSRMLTAYREVKQQRPRSIDRTSYLR